MVRLLLAIGITVGLTLLFVSLFYNNILKLNESPPAKANDTDPDPAPSVKDLGGRLIALTTFAFVFLLGFGFSQFWSTAHDARDAVVSETIDFQRSYAAAQQLPQEIGAPVLLALDNYRSSVVNVEWPLMQGAEENKLADARFETGTKLSSAVYTAMEADKSDPELMSLLSGSVDNLLSDGIDRTKAMPSPMAVSVVTLVFILGIANLMAIAVFQPSRKKANLAIMACMAALTALLLFALVEISNPYTGAGAVTSQLMNR